jgi:hypothetical protein
VGKEEDGVLGYLKIKKSTRGVVVGMSRAVGVVVVCVVVVCVVVVCVCCVWERGCV